MHHQIKITNKLKYDLLAHSGCNHCVGDEGCLGLEGSIGECSDPPTMNNLSVHYNDQVLLLTPSQPPVLTRGYITNTQTQQCENVGKTQAILPWFFHYFVSTIISSSECVVIWSIQWFERVVLVYFWCSFVHGPHFPALRRERMLL